MHRSLLLRAVAKGEDPVRMLDTVVEEMQGDLIRMRQTAAQVLAQRHAVLHAGFAFQLIRMLSVAQPNTPKTPVAVFAFECDC